MFTFLIGVFSINADVRLGLGLEIARSVCSGYGLVGRDTGARWGGFYAFPRFWLSNRCLDRDLGSAGPEPGAETESVGLPCSLAKVGLGWASGPSSLPSDKVGRRKQWQVCIFSYAERRVKETNGLAAVGVGSRR